MTNETGALEQALGRVHAPGELWRRIEQAHAPRSPQRVRRLLWAVAAAAVFAAVAWNLPRPEFPSEDPAQIRAWVRDKTGLDLPFAAHTGAAHLTGARLSRRGVEVAFRTEGRSRSFIVSKAAPREKAHWSSNGQGYVLACFVPGDLDAACRLCHESELN